MSLTSKFKTDASLERKGIGIEFPANADGTIPCIHVARAGRNNPDYQVVVDRIMKPHRRAMAMDILPQDKKDALTREAFAEAGIVGWSNVLASDVTGDPKAEGFVPYTKASAVALLTNLPDLYAALIEISVDHSSYLQMAKEDDAKNSVKSSNTNSTTAATSAP